MPELPEMLAELIEMVDDEEIDQCFHPEPALTEEWCDFCFIENHRTVSLEEPAFTDETSPKQRATIQRLWGRYCDEQEWDDFED